MKLTGIGFFASGLMTLCLCISNTYAGQCKQTKLLNPPPASSKPVVYRFARPIRFHSSYYCPDNGMYYPQTLGCMSPWVNVQR